MASRSPVDLHHSSLFSTTNPRTLSFLLPSHSHQNALFSVYCSPITNEDGGASPIRRVSISLINPTDRADSSIVLLILCRGMLIATPIAPGALTHPCPPTRADSSLPKSGPVQTSYEEKLQLYSLYKQGKCHATVRLCWRGAVGPCAPPSGHTRLSFSSTMRY